MTLQILTGLFDTDEVSVLVENIQARLVSLGWSAHKAALEARLDSGLLYRVLSGKRRFTEDMLEKLGEVEELGLSTDQLLGMLIVDRYPSGAIEYAASLLKGKS